MNNMNKEQRLDNGKNTEDYFFNNIKLIPGIGISQGDGFGSKMDQIYRIDGFITFSDLYPNKKFSYDIKGFSGEGGADNLYLNAYTSKDEPYGILLSLNDLYVYPDRNMKKYYCISNYIIKKFIIDEIKNGTYRFKFLYNYGDKEKKQQPHWYYAIDKFILNDYSTFIIDFENNSYTETNIDDYKWSNIESRLLNKDINEFNKEFVKATWKIKCNKEKVIKNYISK